MNFLRNLFKKPNPNAARIEKLRVLMNTTCNANRMVRIAMEIERLGGVV